MNNKLIFIYIILILVLVSGVFSTNFQFYRDDETQGQIVDAGYEESTTNIENIVVQNKGLCPVSCSYITDQGKSGDIPDVSDGSIPFGKSPTFSIPIIAKGSKVTITVTCEDSSGSWPCTGSDTVNKDVSIKYDYCGDGIKQSEHEICDGGSKVCSQLDSKYYSTKSAQCKDDCSGYNIDVCEFCDDGVKNGAEGCDEGSKNGVKCTSSYGSSCTYCDNSCKTQTLKGAYCGDGKKDSQQENCKTCLQDSPCKTNQECSPTGECITLETKENCASIGDNCGSGYCINKKCVECRSTDDCKSKTQLESTGEYKCSSDYKSRISIMIKKGGECKNSVCTGSMKQDGSPEPCVGKPCQDPGDNKAQCGCLSGYSEYQGQCLKIKELDLDNPCETDFRCKDDFCYKGRCAKALSSSIKVSKTVAQQGEEVDMTISLVNELDDAVKAQLILEPGSGVSITRSDGADVCTSAQCTTYDEIPGKNSKSISLRVYGEESKKINLEGQIKYNFEGKDHHIPLNEVITFIKCGNGEIEEGETSETCCIDFGCLEDNQLYSFTCDKNTNSCDKSLHSYFIYTGIGIIIIILLIIFGKDKIFKHRKITKHEKKPEKEEKSHKIEKKASKKVETKNKASEAQQIKALHKLLKQGILTEEEFNLKKRKVLGIKSKRKRRINYVLISALVFVIISIVLYYNTTINPYQSPKLIFRISAFITLVLFVLSMYKKFKKHVA